MTQPTFIPPAAANLPDGALDSATAGGSHLDAFALTDYGRNFLAHALVGLQRDGWLREAPGPVPVIPEVESANTPAGVAR